MSVSASFQSRDIDSRTTDAPGSKKCDKCSRTAKYKYYDKLCATCFLDVITKRVKDVLSQTCQVHKYDRYVGCQAYGILLVMLGPVFATHSHVFVSMQSRARLLWRGVIDGTAACLARIWRDPA